MKTKFFVLLLISFTNVIANNNTINISQDQLSNLGIEMGRLKVIEQVPLLYAPATVVIPPSQEYIISSAQAGLISKLNVAIGDSVEKGQILAHINSPELLSLQRQYLKAINEKQLAQASFQRDEKLLQEGVISDRRWQESRSRYRSFLAEVSESKQLLEISGMSEKDIKQLATTRHLSSQLNVYSPIQGVILDRLVVAGERLDMLAPIYRIANLDQLWLEINIPQERISQIKINDEVIIENTDITAKITLLGQSVNLKNQTILARAVINGTETGLRIGQNVNSQIVQTSNKSAYIVPNTAIAQSEGQTYLFIRNDNGFVVSLVKIIGKKQNNTVISANQALKADAEIAIKGAVALKAIWLGLGGGE